MRSLRRKLIGDKDFYRRVIMVTIPIIIQQGITNFVSLLDNIMVGQIGTEPMSGVAIANQLMFVFNICIFGAVSGAGIFGAQFYGKGDHDGVRNAFRFKVLVCGGITVVSIILFMLEGDTLIGLYLKGQEDGTNPVNVLQHGEAYLKVMLWGLIPFSWAQCYSSTLRENGETVLPMKAGVVAVLVNLVFNYILIFGKFGAPAMGAIGAAVATVLSRYVELLIILVWTHKYTEKNPFIVGAYRSLKIPKKLTVDIIKRGTPLVINEALWAAGMAVMAQCYSTRGLSVVAAQNISSTISNLFNIVFMAMGSAVSIMVGQLLGAGKMEEARDTDTKLIFFSVAGCAVVGTLLFVVAPLFPEMYKTEELVKKYATELIRVSAVFMPVYAFTHTSYFTLRSGGKTIITFFFDSVFVWVINIPLAWFLAYMTNLPILELYIICQMTELIKSTIGFILVKKGVWINNIVG